VLEAANKYLARVKSILQGSPEAPVVPDVTKEGTRAVLADAALLVHLVEMLSLLDFEVWKLCSSLRLVWGGRKMCRGLGLAGEYTMERISLMLDEEDCYTR
jgi:hypothetical protein